jgi:hypothetical protein
MIEFLSRIGLILGQVICLIFLTAVSLITFEWQCGMCGKINQTGLLRFIFCMCDHDGTGQN